jgi:hypothetical protein
MALHWLALLVSPDCGYPQWFAFFMLPQNFFIFFLFYDFYRKTYLVKNPETSENGVKVESKVEEKPKINREKKEFLNYEKTIAD